jgi:hypothetical protein
MRRALSCLPILILGFLLGSTPSRAQTGRTFYIDYASGSNSNNGTSTATPWKTHPYMTHSAGCDSATPPAYSHVAGDAFIFKGGSTWPAACFPMNIVAGGSSNTLRDAYAGDQTWFTGSSFAKPIFAGQGAVMDGMILVGASNINFSYLDIGGWKVTTVNGFAGGNCDQATIMVAPGNFNVTADHMYLHDWLVPAVPAHANGVVHGITSGGMCLQEFKHNSITLSNSEVSDFANTVSGVQTSVGACGANVGLWYDNCHDLYEGIVGHEAVHGTEMTHISWPCSGNSCGADSFGFAGINHTNLIESGTGGGDGPVYNDYLHDDGVFGEVVDECMSNAVYNLVISNVANIPIRFQTCVGDSANSIAYVYNNTVDESICQNRNGGCPYTSIKYASGDLTTVGKVNGQNNISIGSSPNFSGLSGSVVSNNYVMTSGEATMNGFVPANKYKPTLSDPNVSGQGANLSALCSGSLLALCQDDSGTLWYGGSFVSRPTSPDLGGFQGLSGTIHPPAVSISISPNTQPASGSIFATSTCTPQSPATISKQSFQIDGFPFGANGTTSPYSVIFNTLTTANGSHTIRSTCTDSNALQTSASITVTVSNSMPGCFVSGSNVAWNSFVSFNAQTGIFNFTIGPITPWTNNQDTVIGLSQAPMTAYSQGAALFRFNSSGNIDAWSGAAGNYTAANPAPYSANGNYFLSGSVNVSAGTYSLSETAPSSIVIIPSGTPFTFRTTAPAASLGYLNAISDNSTPDTARVCGFALGGTPGAFSLAPASLNFGAVPLTSHPTSNLTGTVTGNPVTIANAVISGTNAADFAIGSSTCTGIVGAGCTLPIIFTPSLAGAESATLTVTSNASNSPQAIALSGMGTAQATVSPTSLSFGTVKTTQSVTLSGTLTNNGAGTLSSIVESYSGNSQFALASATAPDCQSTSILAPGASCNFALAFTPTAASSYTGTLSLASSMTGSPIAVAATGTGVAAAPGLSLSPTSVAFGSAPVSSPLLQTVTGTTSGGSVMFTSVAVSGANAADFVIGANTCTGTVATSCAIPITFTASIVGAESATLTVTSNATGSPQTVALSGAGSAQAAVNPTSLAFGSVFVGNSGTMQATFTNNGGANLTSVAASVSGSGFALITPTGTDCRASSTLVAKASCNIAVQFAPGSATSFSGSVSVASSMIGSPLSISLSGTGVPAPTPVLTFNLSEIGFGSFALTGQSLPIGIIGTPSGGSVTFTGNPVISGANTADFSLPTNSCSGTISAACTTTVQFTPSIVGPETAIVTYTDNATGSPQTILLTGSGAPQSVVFPGSLTFGNVRIGSVSQLAVTLTNNGGLPLGSIVVSYSGASQFTLSAPSGADCRSITSLPAGSSCTIAMQFLPTTNADFTGTLSIASSMVGSPLRVAVSGTGKKGGRPSGGKNFVGLLWRTIEGKGE